jgi:hypothetical protein
MIIFLRMMEEWEREGHRGGPGEDEGQEDYVREKVRRGRGRERVTEGRGKEREGRERQRETQRAIDRTPEGV